MSFRNPRLMNRDDTALVVIDLQEKLVPAIEDQEKMLSNVRRLIQGAKILGLPVFISEQYPKGLGATVETITSLIAELELDAPVFEKTMFSCRECEPMIKQLGALEIKNLLCVGIESHICVAQSALDFLSMGFNVLVAVDAVGSRNQTDCEVGLNRLSLNGIEMTTTEAALFEWCETASSPEFKQISALVK